MAFRTLILSLVYLVSASANNATLEILRAGANLAISPISANSASPAFEGPPATPNDLAVRRLHTKTALVVDKIWETLNNEQRFAIIKEKGVEKEVLKMFKLNIQSDVFSLDNYITRSKVEQTLKSLALTSTTSTASNAWRQVWDEIHRLKGKIELFYHHFYNHMGSAEGEQVTRLVIEDFAKSIIQPGQEDSNGISNALDRLNKLVAPKPPAFQTQDNSTANDNEAALHKLYAVLMEKAKI